MWSIKMLLKLCLEDRTRLASHHNEKTVPNPEHSHQRQENTQLLRNSYIVLCSGFFCLFFRAFLSFSNGDAAPWSWYCLSDTITNDFHDLKACWVQSTFIEWIFARNTLLYEAFWLRLVVNSFQKGFSAENLAYDLKGNYR